MSNSQKNSIRLAITDYVGFLCRKGHISSEFTSSVSGLEGTHLHQYIQKKRPKSYTSEVSLDLYHSINDNLELHLSGRADGIYEEDERITIEEIKSTTLDPSSLEVQAVHLAQAKIYGYIYTKENNLATINILVTYVNVDTKQETQFSYTYTREELEDFFMETLMLFRKFYELSTSHHLKRDVSIATMKFPYDTFRQGQKEMAMSCFKAIKQNEILFIQAPTGIGKTLSTLYPAIQALGKHTSKVMYLTAKTITRQVAMDSLELMKSQGLHLSYVIITAKEKTCFLDKSQCHPDTCPYANGHYDRINDALIDIQTNETAYPREVIEAYAKKHEVCPFEFSLDLFNFADVSISDYNYAFDPKVNLKRAFETPNDYTLLCDEAHNLVDRSRQMYSASLSYDLIKDVYKSFKPKKGKFYRAFKKIYDYFKDLEDFIQKELPEQLLEDIHICLLVAKDAIAQMEASPTKDQFVEFYFALKDMERISEYYNDSFITYYEDKQLKLFCLDASSCLRPIYKRCKSVILFSATLLPISYFFKLNGGKEGDKKLYFPSPFPQKNMELLIANDIQATYRKRQFSYEKIAAYLKTLLNTKQGHYLVFFPSYSYLNEVSKYLEGLPLYIQTPDMSETDKEMYLSEFQTEPQENKLFLCVLGGIFSEGIDLKGDQVIGVVIVSVGLPQICLERELLKEHQSYEDAYVYPGFNKVLQAAGRLIRSVNDRGVVLLLDERYLSKQYLDLFPQEWHHAKTTNLHTIEDQLIHFYNQNK